MRAGGRTGVSCGLWHANEYRTVPDWASWQFQFHSQPFVGCLKAESGPTEARVTAAVERGLEGAIDRLERGLPLSSTHNPAKISEPNEARLID